MIPGAYLVEASLIAVIVDRLIIERRIGKTPFSTSRDALFRTVAHAGAVVVLLTLAGAGAWIVTAVLLRPLGALYAYPPLLIGMIFFTALGCEIVFSRRHSFVFLHCLFTKAATASSILGLVALAPAAGAMFRGDTLLAQGLALGAVTGAVFCCTAIAWSGIEEKVHSLKTKNTTISLARMLCAAGLLALALSGISDLRPLQTFFRPMG